MILNYLLFFSIFFLATAKSKTISNKKLAPFSPIYDSNNVEEIQKELSECRDDKNSNQNMSEILEELAIMKEYILSCERKIEALTSTVQRQEAKIEDNTQRLGDISTRGRWCGYQEYWTANLSIITYTSLTFSETNMDISDTPFDINSGIRTLSLK